LKDRTGAADVRLSVAAIIQKFPGCSSEILLMIPVEPGNFPEQIARCFDDFVLRLHTSSSRFLDASLVLSSPLWPRLLAQADATTGNHIHFACTGS
jgi:hypothetical protein